jgi:hypothetical protein
MNFLFGRRLSTSITSTPVTGVEPVIAEPVAETVDPSIPVVQSTAVGETTEKIEKMEVSETRQVDLVFIMDCTGSMGSYIEEGKRSIQSIIAKLQQEEKCDVRFGLVAYRDHPPQDHTFVTKIFNFTTQKESMQRYLDSLSASGGGDGPEAVTAGLYAAEHLPWRPNATKLCILIADAPPHGIGEISDGFPNGDPDGHDPLVIARSMASKGITIYPVGCEPALSGYANAKAFMVGLAEITDGYATSLSSSTLLADIILGGTAEEVGLHDLATKYEEKMVSIQADLTSRKGGAPVTEDEVATELFNQMQADNVKTRAWKCDGKIFDSRSGYYTKNARLSDAVGEIAAKEGRSPGCEVPYSPTSPAYSGAMDSGCMDYEERSHAPVSGAPVLRSFASPPPTSATSSMVATETVSYEQVKRVFSKAKKQGRV